MTIEVGENMVWPVWPINCAGTGVQQASKSALGLRMQLRPENGNRLEYKSYLGSSCGCIRGPSHGHARHRRESPEYRSWRSMLARVYGKNRHDYKYYAGRGITVCDRWRFGEGSKSGFECFLEDMGPKPDSKLTIDRWPNKHGNYEPGNCRWATKKEQMDNRLVTTMVTLDGETVTLAECSRRLGWSRTRLRQRIIRLGDQRSRLREAVLNGADATLIRAIGAALTRIGRSLVRDLEKASK